MQSHHKFSIGYFLAAVLLMLVTQSLFTSAETQISYTAFKRYLYEDKVEQVVLSDTLIRGTFKEKAVEEGKSRLFSTVRVTDPELIKALETRGVEVRGQYESPLLKSLLAWIVPVLIFVAIWMFAYRRLSAGGDVMAFGKSRARIYAERQAVGWQSNSSLTTCPPVPRMTCNAPLRSRGRWCWSTVWGRRWGRLPFPDSTPCFSLSKAPIGPRACGNTVKPRRRRWIWKPRTSWKSARSTCGSSSVRSVSCSIALPSCCL